jgi:hypothetical protein
VQQEQVVLEIQQQEVQLAAMVVKAESNAQPQH